MKFLALEQQKKPKDLKSVFHFSRHVFTSQARGRIELPLKFDIGLHGRHINEFKILKSLLLRDFRLSAQAKVKYLEI
jgi:hypothetical protein